MKKRNTILTILLITFLASCGQPTRKKSATKITDQEVEMLASLNMDKNVLELIRSYTDSTIYLKELVEGYDNEGELIVDEKVNGFEFNVTESAAHRIVLKLKNKVKAHGCLIYLSDMNFGHSPDKISVIHSMDQFDILRTEKTDGTNHGVDNDMILKKLQKWNVTAPLQITGASYDWVEASFLIKPRDMDAFAQEVYEFCPDVVDQGAGSVEELAMIMDQTGLLYLWWD